MGKLEKVKDLHEAVPFFVYRLTNAVLGHGTAENLLKVIIKKKDAVDPRPFDQKGVSLNPWIITLSQGKNEHAGFLLNQLAKFKNGEDVRIATAEHPIRWLGAGGLVIVADKEGEKFAVINKRINSILYNNFFDAAGGLSSSIEDAYKPNRLALREIREEVVVASNGVTLDLNLREVKLDHPWRVETNLISPTGNQGNFVLTVDAKTGTIDLRKVFIFRAGSLDDYIFSDGETRMDKGGNEIPTNRPVLLFPLEKLLAVVKSGSEAKPALGFISAKRISNNQLKNYCLTDRSLTPTLMDILLALNGFNI